MHPHAQAARPGSHAQAVLARTVEPVEGHRRRPPEGQRQAHLGPQGRAPPGDPQGEGCLRPLAAQAHGAPRLQQAAPRGAVPPPLHLPSAEEIRARPQDRRPPAPGRLAGPLQARLQQAGAEIQPPCQRDTDRRQHRLLPVPRGAAHRQPEPSPQPAEARRRQQQMLTAQLAQPEGPVVDEMPAEGGGDRREPGGVGAQPVRRRQRVGEGSPLEGGDGRSRGGERQQHGVAQPEPGGGAKSGNHGKDNATPGPPMALGASARPPGRWMSPWAHGPGSLVTRPQAGTALRTVQRSSYSPGRKRSRSRPPGT